MMIEKTYRTLFLSDVHLGTPDSQAAMLVDFLREHRADTIYLVGDIIDCWRMKRKGFYWPQAHNDVVQKLDRVDPRRSVEVEVEVEPGVTASLDGVRADEALSELIGQSRRGARSKVRVSFEDEGEHFVLRVEDDGDGWSQQDADNAFNRLDEPTDRRGTGLGLSVARDLIRAHGGDVTIEKSSLPASRPGRVGGCFVVTFPA